MNNTTAIALLEQWVNAIEEKDLEKTAKLYDTNHPDFIFLPTLSPTVAKNRVETTNYFKRFLDRDSIDIQFSQDKLSTPILTEDHISIAGEYSFIFMKDGIRTEAAARFSFNFHRNQNDEWKIIHHHSSLTPQ